MTYYLIWMCMQCTMTAPINQGLYDSVSACENAKVEVSSINNKDWALKYMRCIPKGVVK